jgi:hypothetical protein
MPQPTEPKPQTIGWREFVSLPDWGIQQLLAKSDTGARGSAIDARRIEPTDEGTVRFEVVLQRKAGKVQTRSLTAPVSGQTRVRSSNGKVQIRYKVRTRLRIGTVEKEIEVSLVNRKHMLCRMLLGRTALEEDFLVDAKNKHLHRPQTSALRDTPQIKAQRRKLASRHD